MLGFCSTFGDHFSALLATAQPQQTAIRALWFTLPYSNVKTICTGEQGKEWKVVAAMEGVQCEGVDWAFTTKRWTSSQSTMDTERIGVGGDGGPFVYEGIEFSHSAAKDRVRPQVSGQH